MKKPRAPRPPKFNPQAARKEALALALAPEIHLRAPLKHGEDLSPEWEDIPHNTQVGRLLLLNQLLKKASFCAPEIQSFLSKYLHTLSPTELTELRVHLPNVSLLHRRDFFTFDPFNLRGVQQLGPRHGPRRFPDTYYLGQAFLYARQHVICDPTSFCNVDVNKGWFLKLASNLSHGPVFADNEKGVRVYSHRAPSFWFGELENAVWLSIIARLALLAPNDPFLAKNQLAIKEAWRTFFGTFSPPSKFNKGNSNTNNKNGCTCPDKGRYVLTSDEYFRTIRPAHLHTSHSGLEISLLKALRAIDAITPENSKFKLEDLYTAVLGKVEEGIVIQECTARPVRKNVFHQVHWTPEVVKIVEEKLPKLTLDAALEVEKFNVRDFGYSARQKAAQESGNGKK